MSYADALARLFALQRFGVRPGLGQIEAALARLGNPERAFPAIHIAGTNGKGSTAAICDAILRADGRRVGLYTSPHLSRFTERIRIGGVEIAEADVEALVDEVIAAGPTLTFFEIVTAMAFLFFARKQIDIAVVEVGLGGRLDATSALARPLVTVVTGIGLEHTEILGSTHAAIAYEKAGIFRAGVPAVAAVAEPSARAVIVAQALRVGAPLSLYGDEISAVHQGDELVFQDGEVERLPAPSLHGAHQLRNAALALAALNRLPNPPSHAAKTALAHTRWPGRLEQIGDVLLDGAHNADGSAALAAALPAIAKGRPITLVLGVVAEKDAAALVAPLLPIIHRLVLTTMPSPRARSAIDLRAALGPVDARIDVAVEADPLAALARGGLTVVAGSLFLVGHVRAHLMNERVDPLVVQDPAPR